MADDQTAVITCVEAGVMEAQVILFARTLRRFGERYAGTTIMGMPLPAAAFSLGTSAAAGAS